jgi:hypothetical protein
MYIQKLESAYFLGKMGEMASLKTGRPKFHNESTSIVD